MFIMYAGKSINNYVTLIVIIFITE